MASRGEVNLGPGPWALSPRTLAPLRAVTVALLATALSACTVGPDFVRPEPVFDVEREDHDPDDDVIDRRPFEIDPDEEEDEEAIGNDARRLAARFAPRQAEPPPQPRRAPPPPRNEPAPRPEPARSPPPTPCAA